MKTKLPAIDADLAAFASTKDISHLEHARTTLSYTIVRDAGGIIIPARRRSSTQGFLRLLRTVELAEDPKFDLEKDKSYLNISLPAGVINLPGGVAPEAIQDPKLRKQYEDALAANAKMGAYVNQEVSLRHFEDEVRFITISYAAQVYYKDAGAAVELKELGQLEEIDAKFLAVLTTVAKSGNPSDYL
jgi:hypothetical protein